MSIIDSLVQAVTQVIIFAVIPFVWWLVSGRRQGGFLHWLGFKRPAIRHAGVYAATFVAALALLAASAFTVIPFFVRSSDMATSQFSGLGSAAIVPGLVYAFVQTGLSEELLFRGFLTKRLTNRFGFLVGNAGQATVFGLMHGLLILSLTGWVGTIVVVVFTGLVGWLMGYINEGLSGGSIVSSWLVHGCANTLAAMIAAYGLVQ